ncbi:hypothetical protein Q763_07380, partial [Flavobacterium beibuense F44-8]
MRNKYLLLFFLSILSFKGFSQAPGCPDVGTFAPAPLCNPGDCTDLIAEYFETGETTSYEVSSVDYAPPYPFIGGTQVSVNTDDVWSPLVTLPFSFCFYGQSYTNVLIGSNGVITFDTTGFTAGGGCPWSYNQTIPNTGFPIKNAIYGVYQDIDPGVNNTFADPNINYAILGSAPCRTLVVNISEVAQFSGTCNSDPTIGAQTSQIVLYETTNVVEVYVERRVPCNSWQGGVGLIGIQNAAGTDALAPPGRNTGNWSATNEAWRFTPNGDSNVEFAWLLGGAEIGTDTTITVCPDVTTTYTAQAIYTACDGTEVIKTQDVTVEVNEPLELGTPNNFYVCATNPPPYTFDLTENTPVIRNGYNQFQYPITYHHSLEDAEAPFNQIINDTAYSTDVSETIFARIENVLTGCYEVVSFEIIIADAPVAGEVDDINVCDLDGDGTEVVDLTVQYNDVMAGLDPNAFEVFYYESLIDADSNTNEITAPDAYLATDGQTIFIRVAVIDDEGCYDITNFDINLTEFPNDVVNPAPMETCDDASNDGLAEFDLTNAIAGIMANEPGMTLDVSVHLSQADADANINPQAQPLFTTTVPNAQTIYFRVQEQGALVTSCYSVVTMDLTVNERPTILAPITNYVQCDQTDPDANDGIEEFDLTTKDTEITGGNVDYAVSYYMSFADADSATNVIANPATYQNTTPFTETIYVRLENTLTGCYSVFDFDLIINALPTISNPAAEFHA